MVDTSAPPPQPGWYPDPGGSAAHRYWDGARWTDAMSSAIPPAGPEVKRDDSRTWARVAHLSALPSMVVAMAFIGPLVVYFVKRDDPFVRRHAAEALNFQLSVLVYALGLTILGFVSLLAGIGLGILLLPLLVGFMIAWFVLILVATVKAGEGAEYSYPLTIHFVR